MDERSESLVLKIGLSEHVQSKLQTKRWATLYEPNFRQDLPELDQRSEITELVEAFNIVNLKVEKKEGLSQVMRMEELQTMD